MALNYYLVRVTKPSSAVSRHFTFADSERLLDFISHELGDKVEFKSMGPDTPRFKVPGYYMPFFTQEQADSYMLGYIGEADVPLLTCKLEDFSQAGAMARRGDI